MALASKIVRDQIPIPDEPGEWVTLRAVSDRKLREASQAQSRDVMLNFKGLPEEVIKAAVSGDRDKAEQALAKKPEESYDWDMLCRSAIVAWSYSARPTPDEIADLTTKTKRWIVQQILEMSRDDEYVAKNSSSDCIVT